MARILYRQSALGASGATGVKGSPLTNIDIDTNFYNLSQEIATKVGSTGFNDADVLTKIKNVDGSGSGLDADLFHTMKPSFDGSTLLSADGATGTSIVARDSSGNFSGNIITAERFDGGLYVPPSKTITFEGSVDDAYETILTVSNPTADRTITFPDLSGTVVISGASGSTASITNDMLVGSIANDKLANSSITIDGNTVALGGTLTVGAGVLSGNNTWTGTQTFRDNKFVVTDDVDTTKKLNLQVSTVPTATTVVLSVPAVGGTIATVAGVAASVGAKTISASYPSGGVSGDLWYRV